MKESTYSKSSYPGDLEKNQTLQLHTDLTAWPPFQLAQVVAIDSDHTIGTAALVSGLQEISQRREGSAGSHGEVRIGVKASTAHQTDPIWNAELGRGQAPCWFWLALVS